MSLGRLFAARLLIPAVLLVYLPDCWAQWRYGWITDPSNGEPLRLATVESKGWRGTLMVRLSADGGALTAFGTPGTILCPEPCQVLVRVNGEAKLRDARPPDSANDMLYFSPRTLPFKSVTTSKKIELEIRLQEHGWKVLSFDTAGFDLERLVAAASQPKWKQ